MLVSVQRFRVSFLSLSLLAGRQVLDLPARALTPICFFKHVLKSPNNLFFQYVLMSRMAGGCNHEWQRECVQNHTRPPNSAVQSFGEP